MFDGIMVPIDAKVFQALREEAERKNRSVSKQLELILMERYHLNSRASEAVGRFENNYLNYQEEVLNNAGGARACCKHECQHWVYLEGTNRWWNELSGEVRDEADGEVRDRVL